MSKDSQAPTEVTPPATERSEPNAVGGSPEQNPPPAPAAPEEDTNS